MNEQIGELLVKENLLSAEQLREAREEARSKGARLGAQIMPWLPRLFPSRY